MRFTLVYADSLKANGDVAHKHCIRRALHKQLMELWKGAPNALQQPGDHLCRRVGTWRFFPLASDQRGETVELSITMLRPAQGPGYVIGQGGDIDNRLKTLFDALRAPQCADEVPAGAVPAVDEDPLFCLLSDDRLIASLAVATDRLLEATTDVSFVRLLIDVKITRNARPGANMTARAC